MRGGFAQTVNENPNGSEVPTMKSAIALSLALAVTTTPLAAQQHMHGTQADSTNSAAMACPSGMMNMMGMMQMMGEAGPQGMMGGDSMMAMPGHEVMLEVMRLTPQRVLSLKDSLDLNTDQVMRIEALQAEQGASASDDNMARRHEALRRAFETENPDPLEVKMAAEGLMSSHARMQAQHISRAAAVRGILSPEQRELLGALVPCPMDMGMDGMMPGNMMRDRHDSDPQNDPAHRRR
jgi:hypothetical protein